MNLVMGIFVGGHSHRMGGVPKGLLSAPGEPRTLVERTAALGRELGAEVVLVGQSEAYRDLGLEMLADARPDSGPLGGLVALLEHAEDRLALAVACDLPHLRLALLRRLAESPLRAPVVAPRTASPAPLWEPLCARYDSVRALPVARAHLSRGELSLQPLLDALGAEELALASDDRAALGDWDSPADLP